MRKDKFIQPYEKAHFKKNIVEEIMLENPSISLEEAIRLADKQYNKYMKLSKQNIEVWVKASERLPKHTQVFHYFIRWATPTDFHYGYKNVEEIADLKNKNYVKGLEWQEPMEDVFVLTEEELVQILSDGFDEGAVWEYEKHFGKVPLTKSKKKFIKSITQ